MDHFFVLLLEPEPLLPEPGVADVPPVLLPEVPLPLVPDVPPALPLAPELPLMALEPTLEGLAAPPLMLEPALPMPLEPARLLDWPVEP